MIEIHDSLDDSATLTVERADADGQTILLNVTADAKGGGYAAGAGIYLDREATRALREALHHYQD